ncbi:base excision dna repair protein [Diaporthe amygdali]|uniref:base excision dna repair protein n=1 Tax=Phomopsis amygdali TaxID=1214568 RepID=UPI0022FF1774|nr:base excision dna repair protein [Diaporthe amygdali]KAJ0119062.1 base excision dna repair protein [Diaporthe amygdali]
MLRTTMARGTRAAASTTQKRELPKRAARVKAEETHSPQVKKEPHSPPRPAKATPRKRAAPKAESGNETPKRVKVEDEEPTAKTSPSKKNTPSDLRDKKLKAYAQYANSSPFPDFAHPTPEECKLAHKILASLHGERKRPAQLVAPSSRAGCGDSPSVLDALVRTILSQNTSDTNSTRAKQSMDKAYGSSDKWDAIAHGGQAKLQEAIKCGGLSVVKSKVILSILEQVYERYGKYSLDHLHEASSEDAMTEMLSFNGVGPKTASCVLLFCLQRESFAVDTHVHRITGLLGWRPAKASRDETHQHLDARIPDEDKYGLHILLVSHGKKCDECRAGGKNMGKCELRKAFRKGKLAGEAGEDVKEEEEEQVKIKDEE